MWTKKNDHVPKSECANICPKGALLERESSLSILLSSLGLHLVNASKMWLANLLTTIFTKK
jgi:hypothetical protein